MVNLQKQSHGHNYTSTIGIHRVRRWVTFKVARVAINKHFGVEKKLPVTPERPTDMQKHAQDGVVGFSRLKKSAGTR